MKGESGDNGTLTPWPLKTPVMNPTVLSGLDWQALTEEEGEKELGTGTELWEPALEEGGTPLCTLTSDTLEGQEGCQLFLLIFLRNLVEAGESFDQPSG